MANDHKTCWNVLEHLGDVFTKLLQDTTAIRTVILSGKVGVSLATKMSWQCAPLASRVIRRRSLGGSGLGLSRLRSSNVSCLVESQLQLQVICFALLRTRTEAHPFQLD